MVRVVAQHHRPDPDRKNALEFGVALQPLIQHVNQFHQRRRAVRPLEADRRRHQVLHPRQFGQVVAVLVDRQVFQMGEVLRQQPGGFGPPYHGVHRATRRP